MPLHLRHYITPKYSSYKIHVAAALFIFLNSFSATAQLIGSVAGNGSSTSSGNGNAATCAGVPSPSGIFVDATGNMLIASPHSIRKVNAADGTISTIAGFTNSGYNGDGGPASAALLDYPRAICTDLAGNIYLAELNGHRIRKIDALTGVISTIAGTGTAGYGGDGGPATSALLNKPYDVKSDNMGNLYVADYQNARIRKINLYTGIITSVAGNGSALHSGDGGAAISAGIALPTSVCTDVQGNIYLAEVKPLHSTRIRKINKNTGIITTIAGSEVFASSGDGGLAIQSTLMTPSGLCTDAQGHVYFSDFEGSRIRKINTNTGIITTLAGDGNNGYSGDGNAASGAVLFGPLGICSDNSGNIYFTDNGNNRVRKIYVNLTSPPPSTPRISITANSTSACSDIPVIITATVTNGTPNMIYQWYKNGINVGTNSNSYAPTSLNHADVISCILTAASCNGVVAINSNNIIITGSVIPAITISASATTVCPGTTIQFTATATNGGPNPTFQWKVNGKEVGSNSPAYTRVLTNSGDNITCELTPDPAISCITRNTVYSNQIGVTVTAGVPGTISIAPSVNDVCPGTPITFTTVTTNAGASPSFQWKINGAVVGSNQPSFTSTTFSDKDEVLCLLVSGSNNCNGAFSSSPVILVAIKKIPVITIFPADTTVAQATMVQLNAIITGSFASFEWNPAGQLTNARSLSTPTIPVMSTTQYLLTVITDAGCKTNAKSLIRVQKQRYMPNSFTPNGDGLNDLFRIPPGVSLKLVAFSVFDRWGKKIFTTRDASVGWDGQVNGIKKDTGTYIYMIHGYDGVQKIIEKGLITLVR